MLNELKDENSFRIGYRDVHSIFSDLQCFSGTSFSENNLIGKKILFGKIMANEKVSKLKIVSAEKNLKTWEAWKNLAKPGAPGDLTSLRIKLLLKKKEVEKKNRKKSNRIQKQAYVLLFFKGSVEYDCNKKIYKC